MKKLISIFIFLILFSFAKAQNENHAILDSLTFLLENTPDSLKANIYNQLAWENRNYLAERTITLGKKAAYYAAKHQDYFNLAKAYSYIGVGYRNTKNFSEARAFYKLGMSVAQKHNLKTQLGYAHINLANWELNNGNIDSAIYHVDKAKKYAELLNNKSLLAYTLLNSGTIYGKKNKFKEGLSYLKKSFKIRQNINDTRGMAISLKYMGDTFMGQNLADSAIFYYKYSLSLVEKISDIALHSQILNEITKIYISTNQIVRATQLANENLRYAKNTQLETNIIDAFSTSFDIAIKNKQYKKAIAYKDSALYHYQQMYDKHMRTKSSRYIQEKNKEEEENLLKKEREDTQKKEKEVKFQRKLNYLMFSLVLLVVIGLIIVFRSNVQKKRANKLLQKQGAEIQLKNEQLSTTNNEIHEQKKKIESQRDILEHQNNELEAINEEIASQRDEIIEQHQKIQTQQYKITESIKVGEKIQAAMLTPLEEIKEILPNSFIFFIPRDIVSGDFYWIKKIGNKIIVTAADCTGHGIPGAFVSMLGISLLNEITETHKIEDAAGILEELRKQIKISLRQSLENEDGQDEGMDMSICVIDTQTNTLQFAGANSSMYLFRKGKLLEYKPTYCPVGIDYFEQPFKNQSIDTQKNDCIYLFSDGYMDQFGGEKGDKLMGDKFQEILTEMQTYPISMQKLILDKKLNKWQGKHKQVDDILILGFQI